MTIGIKRRSWTKAQKAEIPSNHRLKAVALEVFPFLIAADLSGHHEMPSTRALAQSRTLYSALAYRCCRSLIKRLSQKTKIKSKGLKNHLLQISPLFKPFSINP